jgi:hypothetical protein
MFSLCPKKMEDVFLVVQITFSSIDACGSLLPAMSMNIVEYRRVSAPFSSTLYVHVF